MLMNIQCENVNADIFSKLLTLEVGWSLQCVSV